MRFGLFLSNQHLPDADPVACLRDHLAQVRSARRLGFHSVWAGQHFLASPYQMFHPVPVLARVAAEAGPMQVGNCVLLLPLLNPVDVAELGATMDAITDGRYVLGVGLGYRRVEDEAFGVKGDKAKRFEEALALIKRLWTEGEVSFEGKYFRVAGARTSIRPVQKPRPPIWIAGNSDAAVRRAALTGDAWIMNPHATVATLKRQVELYRKVREEAGREPGPTPILREVYAAETDERAVEEAGPILAAKYRSYADWGQDKALPETDRFQRRFEELARDRFIIGRPEACRNEIERYGRELGIDHLILRTQWPGLDASKAMRSIRLLGERVIPHFCEPT